MTGLNNDECDTVGCHEMAYGSTFCSLCMNERSSWLLRGRASHLEYLRSQKVENADLAEALKRCVQSEDPGWPVKPGTCLVCGDEAEDDDTLCGWHRSTVERERDR